MQVAQIPPFLLECILCIFLNHFIDVSTGYYIFKNHIINDILFYSSKDNFSNVIFTFAPTLVCRRRCEARWLGLMTPHSQGTSGHTLGVGRACQATRSSTHTTPDA